MNDDVLNIFVSLTSLNDNCTGLVPSAAAIKNEGMNGDVTVCLVVI
jgi:hypothetical protein